MEQFKTISDVSSSSPYLLNRDVVSDSRLTKWTNIQRSKGVKPVEWKTQTVC